jgi:ring-1,2-phenylacetyl-CoA epoxidase subunit PaaE
MAIHFHPLLVTDVAPETRHALRVRLTVPPEVRDTYRFAAGQFVTLRAQVNGASVQRAYSICSSEAQYRQTGTFDVGIKQVDGGVFSNWAADHLKPQQVLDVMPPEGRFTLRQTGPQHVLGIAAGSGITPMLALIQAVLAQPDSRFTLLYGNRDADSIMFLEALEDLKDRHPARFDMFHVLSRQPQEVQLLHGRIDAQRIKDFLEGPLAHCQFDAAYLCGPGAMLDTAQAALLAHGMAASTVHVERFGDPPDLARVSSQNSPETLANTGGSHVALTVILDGKPRHLDWTDAHPHLLDAGLAAGLDLPFSCKGGVCCTCRARLLEGQVQMDRNFTLEADELAQGFILTCQARALSPVVKVSYDER